jgi:cell wall-associated NlpC family hydrolase
MTVAEGRKTVTRSQVVAAAKAWVGVRTVHGGRTRRGVDCLGLVLCVGWSLGIAWPDLPSEWNKAKLLSESVRLAGARKSPSDMMPGDLAILMTTPEDCHLAIVSTLAGEFSLIQSLGSVVEHRIDDSWKARIRIVHEFCPGLVDDLARRA